MKRHIFALAILFIATLAFSQNSSQSKSILDKAYNAYTASNGIKLSFKLTTTEANGTAYQPQSGQALIKGNKFKLTMDAVDTWFDGKTQWVLMKDVNEVNISNPTGEEIASVSPLALLSMYKTGYTLKAPVSKTVNGKSAYVINITPTASNKDFKSVSVAVDKKTNNLLQVNLTMNNGTKNKIDISNYNANYKFSDSEFVFNKANHKGVEIVDLR